jgi:hypothetical protein
MFLQTPSVASQWWQLMNKCSFDMVVDLYFYLFIYLFIAVLGMEPKVAYVLGKCPTTQPHPQP